MANMYFNSDFKVCSIGDAPMYLYIDSVEDFLYDCGDDYISDNVDETGVYRWDFDCEIWIFADPSVNRKIKALVKEINSLHQENPHQNDKSICWNISVILKTGGTILINSEPISTNEIHEVIDTLLKPSFFGKTINEFKIVAV
jgi:hypothetical protein